LKKGFGRLTNKDGYINCDSKIREFTTIGFGTNINGPAYLSSRKNAPITIGRYCAIGYNLRIRVRNHYTGYANLQSKFQNKYNFPSLASIKGPVTIGNNVWIGDNVIILSGVTIGDGAVIGAGSIVTKDAPPFSIAVGNPAKVIKKRFSDNVIKQLLEIQWWNWPERRIKRNRQFFETDLKNDDSLDIYKIIVD
jgi:virginiamycin A acetyltransferase